MKFQWHEIRELAALLEAEASGRPVDPGRVQRLASHLAEHHPEMGGTMGLICARMRKDSRG